MAPRSAIASMERRARAAQSESERRWGAAAPDASLDESVDAFRRAGRLTINFHPDRITRHGCLVYGSDSDGSEAANL